MSPPSPKIFLDTNIWFSAFYGSENAEKLIKAHIEGKIKATISQQVLEELVRNIKKKIPQAISAFRRLLESTPPQIIKNPKKTTHGIKKWVDGKDQIIFQAAIDAKVSFFVTGNTKDFSVKNLKKKFGIEILTPREAVKKLNL